MLGLIIAEASLELVPKELLNDRSVINHAKKINRDASYTLLDKSYHYHAMSRLKDKHKRGRPDIVHISSLAVTSTPLYKEGMLDLYIHTINNEIITLKNVRLTKSYNRFEGLIIDLFKKRKIEKDDMLMHIYNDRIESLVKDRYTIGLSRHGEPSNAEDVSRLALEHHAMIIVGGFPSSSFSNDTMKSIDKLYSISKYSLDAHVVIARIIYELEKRLIIY
ncbi:MAG: hypothetical protein QW416_01030 [Candidatus Nitrosocaldaceae archaeon]